MFMCQLNNMLSEIVLKMTLRLRLSENPDSLFDPDSDDPR